MARRTHFRSSAPRDDHENPVVIFPTTQRSKEARICTRCYARNFSGETFCKVCGDPLSPELVDLDQTATRRIAPAPGRAKLIVHSSHTPFALSEVSIDKDVALVGRSSLLDSVFPDVDLALADPQNFVSRRHAFILRRRGGFVIEDLESVNGTFVNGTQHLAPHVLTELRDGDEVTFGQTRCTFSTEQSDS